MTSSTPLRATWGLLRAHGRPLAVLTLLVYGPFFAVYKGVIAAGALPADAADTLFGLIGGLLAPLTNGAMIYLLQQAHAGMRVPFMEAFGVAARAFGRLLTSYIIISVVFLFWAVLPMLAAFAVFALVRVATHGGAALGLQEVGAGGFAWLERHGLFLLLPFAAPAVYVASRYAFIDATTVLEGLEAPTARFRSIDLARPRRRNLAVNALLLMIVPTALDFGGDPLAGLAQAEFGLPVVAVALVLNLLAALLYLVPLVYFYAEYVARAAELAAEIRPAPTALAAPPEAGSRDDGGKVLAFKKPEQGGPP